MSNIIADYLSYEEAIATEEALPAGPYEVKAYLQAPLSKVEMNQIHANLVNAGVQLIGISQSGGVLSIKAVKQAPSEGVGLRPVIIIGVLGIAAAGYYIFQLPKILDSLSKIIVQIGLVLLGG